jgi:hypothetical protein
LPNRYDPWNRGARNFRTWYYTFIDHDGRRVERKGCTDKRVTEDMAKAAEVRATRVRNGEISIREADLPK